MQYIEQQDHESPKIISKLMMTNFGRLTAYSRSYRLHAVVVHFSPVHVLKYK